MALHEGNASEVTLPDGRVIRDLTDEEYEATYATGSGWHEIPVDVLEQAERDAEAAE